MCVGFQFSRALLIFEVDKIPRLFEMDGEVDVDRCSSLIKDDEVMVAGETWNSVSLVDDGEIGLMGGLSMCRRSNSSTNLTFVIILSLALGGLGEGSNQDESSLWCSCCSGPRKLALEVLKRSGQLGGSLFVCRHLVVLKVLSKTTWY